MTEGAPGPDQACGPTLICLPGTMCPPGIFDALAAGVDEPVLALPWLEWPGPHDMAALAAQVAATAHEHRPVVLVGHSTGGVVALLAALRAGRSGGVVGVVVCDTGPDMHGHGDVDSIIDRIAAQWGPPAWTAFAHRCVERDPGPEAMAAMADYPASLAPGAVVEALRSQRATDLGPELAGLDVPLLVVHGRRDRVRHIDQAHALVGAVSDAELAVLDCGHTPPVELPNEFVGVVADWLGRKVGR